MRSIFEKLGLIKKRSACSGKDCASGQPPTRTPVVAVWARFSKDHDPACFVFSEMKFCLPCSKQAKLKDFVDDSGQRQINEAFGRTSKPLPRWETAELQWRGA